MSGFEVLVDGRPALAQDGDTVAAVLMRSGQVSWRRTRHGDEPRGLFCGMGACQDCLVTVDEVEGVRACLAPAAPGMRIATAQEVRGG